MKPGPKPIPPETRFWAKIQKGGDDECWIWTAGKAGKGYGQFYRAKRVPIGAHRYSWELHNSRSVPPGMQVMHLCDNPPCVNPAHLRIGTCQENLQDAAKKGRNPGNRTNGGGRKGGRPRTLDPVQLRRLRESGLTYQQIAAAYGVANSTIWRNLNA